MNNSFPAHSSSRVPNDRIPHRVPLGLGSAIAVGKKKLTLPAFTFAALQTLSPAQVEWKQLANAGPSNRVAAAMAYDEQRDRTVLFGGLDLNGGPSVALLADTWEWDGNAWHSVAFVQGPPARVAHAMAYDSQRRRTVLFGGTGTGIALRGDTWEWDGSTWTQVASTGPSPRNGCRMAYDSGRGRTVLFGGQEQATLFNGDTWEWDGSTWTQVANTGPSGRRFSAMAYDSQRGRTVLFGGNDSSGVLGDTWEWDGTAWMQVASTGPLPRWHHAMAYDSFRGRTVMFGGDQIAVLGDTWEWDGSAWTKLVSTGLSGRIDHTMAYDAKREQVLLFSETETWARRGGLDAAASTFGAGCGNPALALSPLNRPVLATTAKVAVSNVPSSLAAVFLGLSDTSFPPHSLPLSLAPFGLPGCELLVSIDVATLVQTTGQGTAGFGLQIPHVAALTGQFVFLQALAPSPAAAGGIVFSNGVRWEIGNN